MATTPDPSTGPEYGPGPLSAVDATLLRAARAWRPDLPDCFWDGFPADRRIALRWAWQAAPSGEGGADLADPAGALDRLRRDHAAQARPDLARVHSSWWVRALEGEPASVRRAVAANLPATVAEALREGLGLADDDLRPDRPADPGALRAALALWAVKLSGDHADDAEDAPVVVALTAFDARTVARLVQTTGLAKWALTPDDAPDLDEPDRRRLTHLRGDLVGVDPRFVQVAGRDLAAVLGHGEGRPVARVGLLTVARLLGAVEPYRARWALQHLPYATARSVRALMGPPGRRAPMLARWESDLLRAAWRRLADEGRLRTPWPQGAHP